MNYTDKRSNNRKNSTSDTLSFILIILVFLIILGFMGSADYQFKLQEERADIELQVLRDSLAQEEMYLQFYNLPQNVFESISIYLGDGKAIQEYLNEYETHQEFYDSMPINEILIFGK